MSARQYAQKIDRFKFHRVIALLRELEKKAQEKLIVQDVLEEKKANKMSASEVVDE